VLHSVRAETGHPSRTCFDRDPKQRLATAGQIAKDRGASIEAVARALRHSTTKTTERYYARVQTEDAFAEWERAMANPVKVRG